MTKILQILLVLFCSLLVFSCKKEETTQPPSNNAPSNPSDPSPTDGSTHQSITVTLSWNCTDPDSDPLTYDIYFGNTNPPTAIVSANQTATTLERTALEASVTYYWKIVAKDGRGDSTSGDVWRFTTAPYTNIWNISNEYSITNNPNGVWSYGRKWSADGNSFDVMTVRWGTSGWYFGNVGHGGPSITAGPNLWAKDNSNGLPDVRWTSPLSGTFRLSTTFTGNDSRGVDVIAYIAMNDSIVFSDNVRSYLDSTQYSSSHFWLNQGDHIDFLVKWNGGVYSEYGWTRVNAIINRYGP